jgi:type IV secretory pathway TraG/TraD family ATPase VirD4
MRLAEYPLRQKGEDVDWEQMPQGRCDMNFRPPRKPLAEKAATLEFVRVASVCSALCVLLITIVNAAWPFLFVSRESIFLILVAAAVPLVIGRFNRKYRIGQFVYMVLVVLLLASNFARLFSGESKANFFVAAFLLGIVPFVLYTIDSIMTHFVHWTTASPRLDLQTMVRVRRIWSQRFRRGLFRTANLPGVETDKGFVGPNEKVAEFLTFVAYYPAFLLGAFAAVFLATIFALLSAPPLLVPQALLMMTVALTFGLAVIVDRSYPNSGQLAVTALATFSNYRPIRKLPSMIQSPTPLTQRSELLFSSVLMLSFAVSSFWFSWGWFHITFIDSAADVILQVVLQFTILLAVAPLLLFSMFMVAAGPTIWWFDKACEGKAAILGRKGWTTFDAYANRLRFSGNRHEKDGIWLGFHQTLGFPILVPAELVGEHMHILGGSGSGKTGLGIMTLVNQLIKRNDGPVIIIDGKGDPALFQSSKIWTEEEHRKFKWFTTANGKSTYLFNPFAQTHLQRMALSEIVGLQLLSMNLFHGSGYGRSFFSAASKEAINEGLKSYDGQPDHFEAFLRHLNQRAAEDPKNDSGKHLAFMMRTLSEFAQLNNRDSNGNPASESVIQNAIKMSDVIRNNQVVYFNFESITDPMSTGEISRLALYSTIAAAKEFKEQTGKPPVVYVVIDEAQNVMAANVAVLVEQARSYGVALIFCHQNRDQLDMPGGDDLRQLVDESTCIKQIFSARTPESRKHIASISGEVGYYNATWRQFVYRVQQGEVTMDRALATPPNAAITDVTVQAGPRLTTNEIEDVSLAENGCIFSVNRSKGTAQFKGAFPIHIDFPIDKVDYDTRNKMTWPEKGEETIEPKPFWPAGIAEETVRKRTLEKPETDLDELYEVHRKASDPNYDPSDYYP